jgi:FtsZ-binding cell division protein ZapB
MAYHRQSDVRTRPSRRLGRTLAIAAAATAIAALAAAVAPRQSPPASLEGARLTLSKWIETQQIIAKERNDWAQGKEILEGRIDLVGKEVSVLKEKIAQSEAAVADSNKKRDELLKENGDLKALASQLDGAARSMEAQVQVLAKSMPEGVLTKLQPLLARIPAPGTVARVSTAERFQNVLGILNEMNRANSEISVAYEIRKLADGTSSEVQVIYVGLAQAYYISPTGEAGVGVPGPEGWQWSPLPKAASDILFALEIIQGKHSPAFVPLPVTIQ